MLDRSVWISLLITDILLVFLLSGVMSCCPYLFCLMTFFNPGVNCHVWIPSLLEQTTLDLRRDVTLEPYFDLSLVSPLNLYTDNRLWIHQSTSSHFRPRVGGVFVSKDPQNTVGWSGGLDPLGLDPLGLEPVCVEPWTSLSNFTWTCHLSVVFLTSESYQASKYFQGHVIPQVNWKTSHPHKVWGWALLLLTLDMLSLALFLYTTCWPLNWTY